MDFKCAKNMKQIFKVVPMGLVMLAFGACTTFTPGVVITNGESFKNNPKATNIQAQGSYEVLFGFIGLNDTQTGENRDKIRESLANQCQGGHLENISVASKTENYILYAKVTTIERATCIAGK